MRRSAVVLAGSFLSIVTFLAGARAQPDDAARIKLSALADFAGRVCGGAPMYIDRVTGRLTPAADVEWASLLRGLSAAGLQVRVGGGISVYRGILQRDLPAATANNTLCRTRVAEDLGTVVFASRVEAAPLPAEARVAIPQVGMMAPGPAESHVSLSPILRSGSVTEYSYAAEQRHAFRAVAPNSAGSGAETTGGVAPPPPAQPTQNFSPQEELAEANSNPDNASAPSAPAVTHAFHHHAARATAVAPAGPAMITGGGPNPAAMAQAASQSPPAPPIAPTVAANPAAAAGSAAQGPPNQVLEQFAATQSDLVAEFESLPEGQIVFNPPGTMTQGQSVPVDVRITTQTSRAALGQGLEGPGTPQYAALPVGTVMKVELAGDGFTTELEGADKSGVQTVLPGTAYAEWIFDVTPTDSGTKYLNLRASVQLIAPDGLPTYQEFPVLKRAIKVNVSPMGMLLAVVGDSSQWRWVLGGIGSVLVLAGGYLGKRWLERRG